MSILTSDNLYLQSGAAFRQTEHPILTTMMLRFAAHDDAQQLMVERMSAPDSKIDYFALMKESMECARTIAKISGTLIGNRSIIRLYESDKMALPAGVAEVFGSRLAARIGLNTAKVTLSRAEPKTFTDFIKQRKDVWIRAKRIPRAVPVYHLKNADRLPAQSDFSIEVNSTMKFAERKLRPNFKRLLDKRCEVKREAYKDFPAALEDDSRILAAAAWNSDERCAVNLFRAMLNCTYAHSSNLLCDVDARLFTIDWEKFVYRDNNEDLVELARFLSRSPRLMDIAARIAQLQEKDIRDAFQNIPRWAWNEQSVIANQQDAIDYFIARLRVWKQVFPPLAAQE